jgi:hypothetical protein
MAAFLQTVFLTGLPLPAVYPRMSIQIPNSRFHISTATVAQPDIWNLGFGINCIPPGCTFLAKKRRAKFRLARLAVHSYYDGFIQLEDSFCDL